MFGRVVEFAGDQYGSRFIQDKLQTATAEQRQMIFDEIVPQSVLQLSQDVFGNYASINWVQYAAFMLIVMLGQVVQKLFEYGTQIQKAILASTLEGRVVSLSMQVYSCRVVQKVGPSIADVTTS